LLNLSGSLVRVLYASETVLQIYYLLASLQCITATKAQKERSAEGNQGLPVHVHTAHTQRRMRAVKDGTILFSYQHIYLVSQSGASSPTDHFITQNHRTSGWKRSLEVIYWQH